MSANASYLSSPKYGYDFVVSTTQASINSGLLEYLSQGDQPTSYICFLADSHTGNVSEQILLDELKTRSGGVDPFEIPEGTAHDDPRILALTHALFICGIKIQVGLPRDVMPKNLPAPVVVLGNSANNVGFNMYCSEFTIIQNSPGSGFNPQGSWNVWSQPSGTPWYVETTANLVTKDLSHELDTPYFNKHPQQKAALLAQLDNLSGTLFSLQQLLFDLDNAVLQTVPTFEGIPKGSNAQDILQKSFISIYSASVKEYGEPLISVKAVAQTADPSQLRLTGFEREVSPLVDDSSGVPIDKPTALQQSATTLNYLCAINHHSLQGAASFNWNWVEPKAIDTESGIIAINRNAFGNYLLEQLNPTAARSCLSFTTGVVAHMMGAVEYSWDTQSPKPPQTSKVTDSGEKVITISYSSSSDAHDKSGATYGEISISPTYTCDVSFSGNQFTVTQHLVVSVYAFWDATDETIRAFDKTLTEVYTISVDENGGLRTSAPAITEKDDSQSPSRSNFVNFWTSINDITSAVKSKVDAIANTSLGDVPLNSLQSFIFPGAKDLVCAITYVKTNLEEIPDVQPKRLRTTAPKSPRQVRGASSFTNLNAKTTSTANTAISKATRNDINATKGASMRLNLTYSSEMMQNYVQGEFVSPQGKFEALQTDDGHALLFATDSNGVLNVVEEQNGKTHTGWALSDISSAVIKAKFTGATVSTFNVGQSALDGTIRLAMAVSSGGSDHLLVSLSNSSSDTSWISTSWISEPNWTVYPFDNPTETREGISIAGVLFSETMDKKEYLIVDIDRNTGSTIKDIVRYYIDPSKSSGYHWVRHDVPVDIEHGDYQSCVGRAGHSRVDGVYTSGKAAGVPQLVYVPIINEFGDGPPMPTRLDLPDGASASAIATARNMDQTSPLYGITDLYAVGGSTLYRFSAEDQDVDGVVGQPLITDSFLARTDELRAMIHDGVTTLWGKNSSDHVYYLSCPTDQVALPRSWSTPVPILTGIEHVSTYVNRQDGGNTVFASGGGKLQQLNQASNTSSKLWLAHEIKLAVSPSEKSLSFNSYTTTLQVADANDLPARNVPLTISTKSRTPVYMNGLYYVLGQTPVNVETDSMGSVTVIEATENLNGTILGVSADPTNASEMVTINPMDKPFKKLATLNTKDALKDATFPTNTKAGGLIAPSELAPLVSPSTSDEDAKVVADNMGKLKTVYDGFNKPKAQPVAHITGRAVPATNLFAPLSLRSVDQDIAIAIGDLFQWLKSEAEAVIRIVQEEASEVWHFLATIAGKVYRAVLDTAEAVVGAVEWAFKQIKTAVDNVVHFVEFLFQWDDIRRTKDAMHNVVKLYLQHMASDIRGVQAAFNSQIANVEQTVNHWSGIEDWSPLGDTAGKPASLSASNPAKGQTSSSQLLSNHFRDHAGQLTVLGGDASVDVVQNLGDDLLQAIEEEGAVLAAVYDQLKQLAVDFHSMSVGDVLKRVAGILADGILSSVQVVVDALLNVLYDLASAAIDIIDAKIHVPIISDILNAIGIPDISFLDLFTWIASVCYTVVYKIAKDEPPFPDDAHTKALISAQDWNDLIALFNVQPTPATFEALHHSTLEHLWTSSLTGVPVSEEHHNVPSTEALFAPSIAGGTTIFIAGHSMAGLMAFMSDFLSTFEATEMTGDNSFSIPSTVVGAIQAASAGVADILAPKDPIENKIVSYFMDATTAIVLMANLMFCGPVQEKFKAPGSRFSFLAAEDGRATGAVVNAILVVPALVGTGWHFYELSEKPPGKDRSAAIVGEVSNLCSYVSRISYMVAANDEEPESKMAAVGVMAVSNLAVAGLQTARKPLSTDRRPEL
ncbi:hypothetical protein AUP68_04154 [Ilyonectria robusta]